VTISDPLQFEDGDAWTVWLADHHATEREAWLRIGKKNASTGLIAIGEALDGALCFGWIDGQRRGLDDVSFLQRYCPRTKRSTWSQVNVDKAEELITAGRMAPAGQAEIEAAKADGRWDAAYVRQRDAEPPPDLLAALAERPGALAAFESLSRTDRYLAYLPLLKATSAAARQRALERVVQGLSELS
jgi:uncharacterized protein YdeI (YjbR/CyaY-like superfamily)